MNIILIGFKNCGKTSVGKLLAEKLKASFVDTDRLIEKYYFNETKKQLTVRDIYQQEGELYFRHLEKLMIHNLDTAQNRVIATGGGCVLNADNVTALKKHGELIYLHASIETLLERALHQPRPAFLKGNLMEHYEQRKNIYSNIADKKISIENKSVQDIAEEIILLVQHTHA